ncbi:MAG: TIGR04283 family arsenosugar biosynthesis glycosyltransferase [Planctomycetota bacterium]
MPADLKLSIVIPTINEEAGIADAVARAWRLRPVEVIVSDGGSVDRTATLARQAGAIVLGGPAGRGRQLNRGATGATGEVLLFLHADTWLPPEAAEQLAEALADDAVLWGAFRQAINAGGWRYRALEWGNAYRAHRLQTPYGDQAIFTTRSVFDQVGGFADVPIMEDVDLSRRLRKIAAPRLLTGPLHTSARRWRRHGVIRQTIRNWGVLLLWRLGVAPRRLAAWYRPHVEADAIATKSKRAAEASPAADGTRCVASRS